VKYITFSDKCKQNLQRKRRIKTMEMSLNNGFCEVDQMEMETINGGSIGAALVCVCAGVIGVVAGPPTVITGAVAVGCWYAGSALIAAGGVVGACGY
jgi:hypothetical protein